MSDVDDMLSLLENKARREILERLVTEPHYAYQLADQIGVSQQAITKHLTLLESAGMVQSEKIPSSKGPAKRIYFAVQMMYMFSDKERHYQGKFNELVAAFIEAVPSSTPILLDIGRKVIEGNLYSAMKDCKKLMRYEEEVLTHVTQ